MEFKNLDYVHQHLTKSYERKNLCDLQLVVGKEKKVLKASKYLLGSMSEVFEKMLFGGMKEAFNDKVEIKTDNVSAFESLVTFCMTGQCSIKAEDLISVFVLADQYFIEPLKKYLLDEIENNLNDLCNKENVIFLLDFCSMYNLSKEICCDIVDKTILENSSYFLQEKRYDQHSKRVFITFISSIAGNLRKKEEIMMLKCIYKRFWKNGKGISKEEKEEGIHLILKYINFQNFDGNDFVTLQKMEIFDFEFLFKLLLVLRNEGNPNNITSILPKNCSTFNNLPKTFFVRNGFKLDNLLISKDSITKNFVQHFGKIHDGGSAFDGESVWSHYGNDNNGKTLYVQNIKEKDLQKYPIPFSTHGSYPIFDGKRTVYILEGESGHKRIIAFDTQTRKNKELKASSFQRLNYCVPLISNHKIFHITKDRKICHYDISKDEWKVYTKTSLSTDYISFCPHKNKGMIWVKDNQKIRLYDLTKETWVTIMDANTCSGGNTISFPIKIKKGYHVFCYHSYSNQKWYIADPYEKKGYNLQWNGNRSDYSGHAFIHKREKKIYYNVDNQWKVVDQGKNK